jgi:hypothetical protein
VEPRRFLPRAVVVAVLLRRLAPSGSRHRFLRCRRVLGGRTRRPVRKPPRSCHRRPLRKRGADARGLSVGGSRSLLGFCPAPAWSVTIPRTSRGHSGDGGDGGECSCERKHPTGKPWALAYCEWRGAVESRTESPTSGKVG